MLKVKITKQTVAARKNVRVGDIVEISISEAQRLVGIGKAIYFEEPVVAEVVDEEIDEVLQGTEVADEEIDEVLQGAEVVDAVEITQTKKGKKNAK